MIRLGTRLIHASAVLGLLAGLLGVPEATAAEGPVVAPGDNRRGQLGDGL